MTDNEIIKALECCCSPKVNACDDCPFYERCYENNEWLEKEAIDLINRQKAEIKRLQKANESFSCMGKMYSEIKAEARKEFWEQIKAMYGLDENDIIVAVNIKDIDNILAEMESERK